MPAYSNAAPPLALFPGDVGFSFNAEAFPGAGTAGAQFAIPEPAGLPDQGHTVRWQTIFGSAPTAVKFAIAGCYGGCGRGICGRGYFDGYDRRGANGTGSTRAIFYG